jgi:ADP-ribose pyrophosphatase
MKSQAHAKKEQSSKIESKWIYRGRIISLRADTITSGKEPPSTYDIVLHPGAVVMIPIDDKENIIFVKQWRRAIQKIIIELPAGTLEKEEPPEKCAQRELQEEIGYKAEKLTSLGGFFTAPGFCNEYLHLFLAQDLQKSHSVGDDTDLIDIVSYPLGETLAMIASGEISDAKTIIGVWKWRFIKKDLKDGSSL